MIETPQSARNSDRGVGAAKTDNRTTSNILLSLVGCQTEEKLMKSRKGPFQCSYIQTPRACVRGTNDTDEKTAL